jgi:hypothetical protein
VSEPSRASDDDRGSNPALSGRAVLLALGVFVLATLVVFGGVLLDGGRRVVSAPGNDLELIFYHWHEFGFGELRKGNLALWNPHVYSGAPYFGSFQPGLLYPVNWLNLVLATPVAINVGVALDFVVAGMATYLWAAHRRLAPAACILAGLVFMFCGPHFLQVYRGHLPNLRTIAWTPLVLLAVDGALTRPAASWILLGALAVAMQILAGHVQETLYTGAIVGVYALFSAVRAPRRLRALASVAAMYVVAAGLTAAQLGAGMAAVADTMRSAMPYELASTFAFPPENIVTLIVPGIFGDMVTIPYWARWTLSEMSLFIGVVPFLLALYGACAAPRVSRRFAVVFAVLTVVLALGSYTPLYRPLYDYVPLVASFRGTTKFLFLTGAFLAMLTALGADRLLRTAIVPRWPAAVAAVAGVVLLGAALAIGGSAAAGQGGAWAHAVDSIDLHDVAFSYDFERVPRGPEFTRRAGEYAAWSLTIAGGTFVAAGALWMATRRQRRAAYGLLALGAAELLVYAGHSLPTFPTAPVEQEVAQVRNLQAQAGPDARLFLPNPYAAMTAHAYDVWAHDPMLSSRYADVVGRAQNVPPATLLITALRSLPPVFGLLRLRYVLDGTKVIKTSFRELPRAALMPRWQLLPRERVLDAIMNPDFDGVTALVETAPTDWMPADDATPPAGAGGVRVVDLSTDAMEIWTESAVPALLVVSDPWWSGWQVSAVDRTDVPARDVMPVDYVLRGVPLAAGRHHLRMEYRPAAYRTGVIVNVVALVLYACAVAIVGCRAVWFPVRPSG